MSDWVVSDSKGVKPGEQVPILATFATHDEAADYIGTLPEHETGRYNLDGPSDDEPPAKRPSRESDEHVADFVSFPWFQGTTRYKGTCSCGWAGGKTANQADARNAAVAHATAANARKGS